MSLLKTPDFLVLTERGCQNSLHLTPNMQEDLLQAASSRDPDKMLSLLKGGADPNVQDSFGNTPLHLALTLFCSCNICIKNAESCCAVLLNVPGIAVNVQNKKGETPLHVAATYQLEQCIDDLIYKRADCYLTAMDGVPPMMLIANKTPDVMCKILDESITIDNDNHKSENCIANINFRPIILTRKVSTNAEDVDTFCNELKLLESLLSTDMETQKKLFLHPVVSIFLDRKWRRASIQLVISVLGQLFWLFFFTYYMFEVYLQNCPCTIYKASITTTTANASTDHSTRRTQECLSASEFSFMFFFICSQTVVRLGYQLLEMRFSRTVHLLDICHVIIMCLALGTFYPTFTRQTSIPTEQYQYAAFTIFMAWSMNMSLFGKFKKIGGYFEIFGHVLGRFISIVPTFIFLYAGFAYAFRIMFPSKPFFGSIPYSMMRVVIMTMGTDYYSMFYDGKRTMYEPVVGHLMYVLYVLMISIVLLNLVIGLTVSDIQNLQDEAQLKQITRQIAEMYTMEYIMHSGKLPLFIRKFARKALSLASTLQKGDSNQLYFSFKINDPRDRSVPEDLKAAAKPLVERIHNERKSAVCERRKQYTVNRRNMKELAVTQ